MSRREEGRRETKRERRQRGNGCSTVEEERGGRKGRGKFHGENRHGPVQVKSRESGQFPWHRPANPRRSFHRVFSPGPGSLDRGGLIAAKRGGEEGSR